MIQYIKNFNFFKPKKEHLINTKDENIFDILEDKYNDYGSKLGVIYVTREQYKEYILYIMKHSQHILETEPNIRIELDPSTLREEKLTQLGI